MKFSFIIPTVKQTTLVENCIKSVRQFELNQDDYEIIVVDDGSDPSIQAWLKNMLSRERNAVFIPRPKNLGFATTVNIGLKHALGKYLILLNNDVLFIKPILGHLEHNFLAQEKTGVIGAKLLFPPGTKVQHAGVVRLPGGHGNFVHINKHVARNNMAVNKSTYYPSVTGALYAIRRECWEEVGDWNENYFLSCEDTEYSLRCWAKGWHVFYNHNVEALHIEGHTRGNTDLSKKKKDIEWFMKERQTIPKFIQDVQKYDVDSIDRLAMQLNAALTPLPDQPPQDAAGQVLAAEVKLEPQPLPGPVKRLEVGCGEYPQPGFIHLDIRKFPHIDIVCDFANERLPFEDAEIDEILSNHSIEHISWRKLPHVIGEWHRVLKPGGKVFFRTPDLEFICRTYLEGKTTPEAKQDEEFVTKNLAATVTPAWWANIKLFAGQDYDGNYHYFAFDFATAKATLERYGFERVTRLNILPVFSPGELQVEAFKPGLISKGTVDPSPAERILVKRRGAIGDVLLTTPIVRRLREIYGQQATINVATDCGVVYTNNPYVNQVLPSATPIGGYSKFIDLDLAYERSPDRHVIDAYSEVAFGADGQEYDKRTDLFPSESDFAYVATMLGDAHLNPDECVVVHMAATWKNRTWPKDYWHRSIKHIVAKGLKVILVGQGADFTLKDTGVYDFSRKLTIHQIAALVSVAKCFVANDSGLIHVAGTTATPIVGLFTCAKGEYRMPYREGQLAFNAKILKPQVDCYGCLHREKPPVVYADCRRGDYKCLSEITPEMVADAVCNPM